MRKITKHPLAKIATFAIVACLVSILAVYALGSLWVLLFRTEPLGAFTGAAFLWVVMVSAGMVYVAATWAESKD